MKRDPSAAVARLTALLCDHVRTEVCDAADCHAVETLDDVALALDAHASSTSAGDALQALRQARAALEVEPADRSSLAQMWVNRAVWRLGALGAIP